MAAERAPPPWRIHRGSGKPAGDRRFSLSDRGRTAAGQQTLLSTSTWSLWGDSYSVLWCPSSYWDPERRSWQPKDNEIHAQSAVRGKDRRDSDLRLKKRRAAGSSTAGRG
ncbi:hypothetical protein NDU88_001188 [Pleurodeles waltl]|uniref:Uncharacterized protein n=1 Tax=Pleurodeles waltl TaxID=8319 RepID=A0AAV7LAQ8_PLEWA|nr:hypothetical protein NDU88_001188 [Pleurodeles waltl]